MVMKRTLLATLLLATSAAADPGELSFDITISPEVASAAHPAVDVLPLDPNATTIFKPRLGLGVRYGVTNSFYVGLAANAAASTSIQTPTVTIDNSTGGLLTAQYLELSTPVMLGWRADTGGSLSAAIEMELAPLAVFWGTQNLVDFNDLDDAGLPSDLEKTSPDVWLFGGQARVQMLFDARVFDVVGLDIGPSVSVSWTGAPAVHVGLVMRPTFIWGGVL
jgi:hypothetical protein